MRVWVSPEFLPSNFFTIFVCCHKNLRIYVEAKFKIEGILSMYAVSCDEHEKKLYLEVFLVRKVVWLMHRRFSGAPQGEAP